MTAADGTMGLGDMDDPGLIALLNEWSTTFGAWAGSPGVLEFVDMVGPDAVMTAMPVLSRAMDDGVISPVFLSAGGWGEYLFEDCMDGRTAWLLDILLDRQSDGAGIRRGYPPLDELYNRGFEWMVPMASAVLERMEGNGLTARLKKDSGAIGFRSVNPSMLLSAAVENIHASDRWRSALESGDPGRFGTALADSIADVLKDVPIGDITLFPSLSLRTRWLHAISEAPVVPLCASTTDALRFVPSATIGGIVSAMECGGDPDYSFIERWADGHECIALPPDALPLVGSATGLAPGPRSLLGVLLVCDAMLMIADRDPANPGESENRVRGVPGRSLLAAAVVPVIVKGLRDGLPVDMISENPSLRRMMHRG